MMAAVWNYPTRIRFGAGEAAQTGNEVRALGATRVLVVSDAGVERVGLLAPIVDALRSASLEVAVFTGVSPNPVESDVAAGVASFREHRADAIVAVGGGSPIDAAKLIAVRVATPRPFEELDDAIGGDRHIPRDLVPIVALPTTAGTGSEVGRSGVVTLSSTGRKTVIFSPSLLPRVAILDPELTRGLPAGVTAATGFDALTHCIEAFVSKGDHPLADGIALMGIELVHKSLRRAVEAPHDLVARGDMLKAAMMGAVAFQKGLGACHSMAHPLSSEHAMHHGLANALCLPVVVQFNDEVVMEKQRRIATVLGGGRPLHELLAMLRRDLGLPTSLQAAHVPRSNLEHLAELAYLDACHQSNPQPVDQATFKRLFEQAF
jgi:4-hydroxybutyrate dehydrogenase